MSEDFGSRPATPSVPTCPPEFARFLLPSVYTALDCVVSEMGSIALDRLEFVVAVLERSRDATKATSENSVGTKPQGGEVNQRKHP